jgi:enamine deaminase RidA (YjgF/YER057c/UK114 family)
MSRFKPVVPSSMRTNYDMFHFAPAVVADNRVYASGQIGVGADGKVSPDLETQFTDVFERVGEVLEAAGATFADIVEISTFHIGLQDHIQQFIAVKDRFIVEPYPAWTAVGTTELAIPGAVVEIKVIAHI